MSKASTLASKASKASAARTRDQLVQALVAGEIGFHELPRDLPPDVQAEIRRQALEQLTGTGLEDIGHFSLDSSRAALRNCENFIGVAQVPMGVVGPLHVRSEHMDEEVYVPLATTEAALVASTNRGCSAIRAAGGARVHVEDVGMTRAPVFRTSGLDATRKFIEWVEERIDEIRHIAERTSRHLKLLDIRPKSFGTTVLLRFRFASGDAMGMNMATIACDRIVRELIEPETGVDCVALSGNYCVDKKPAAINFHEGRGKRIFAEVILEAAVLRRILKTTSRALVEVQYRKNLLGSIAAGAVGFNAHYANLLAALFIATGQDPAHVVEGSMGITCIEAFGPEAVYASVYMPAVPIGCVGGGTELDTQREALEMLGIKADPSQPGRAALRLAEIFGATVLAGEMSLMAAFTSQDLASAHEKLGRGNAPPDDRPGSG
ncbi:MAG: hydroxymethylglutaryl-CoA reductase (NADPH) [Gemmatimonadales bacterium]